MSKRVLRWLTVGAFCSTAATCGQKGPLELPEEEAVVRQTTSALRDPEAGDRAPYRARQGRPYEGVSRHLGSVCAGSVGDGLVPSRRALWARTDDTGAMLRQTISAVRPPPAGDRAPYRARQGRPYEDVPRHLVPVCATWREPDGLHA